MTTTCTCRLCGAALGPPFLALGPSPVSNAFLTEADLARPEPFFPLDVHFCEACALVQVPDIAGTLFDDHYVYFSSFSASWLAHARRYCDTIGARLGLDSRSFVVEVASNDGYLLQNLVARGIPVLGVEPTANTAAAAVARGVPTEVAFFGRDTARRIIERHRRADLVIANNVLAHVPDLADFVDGFALLLAEGGTATFEFPHLLNLVAETQFDTIYHEHYSYLSVLTARRLFARHGLEIWDIEELPTHGGSLRLYVGHAGKHAPRPIVDAIVAREIAAGLDRRDTYERFAAEVGRVRDDLVAFLRGARQAGEKVVGYGAPAKGNTLLNYCRVTPELLPFTVDRSPHKQGRFLPGTHVPVLTPEALFEARPDYVLILPWNLKDEIAAQLAGIAAWGGQLVVPIPRLAFAPAGPSGLAS